VDTKGTLIFQEGKKIEGEFYVIAVYDDPRSCTISFSAYELENDATYTYPLTYSEFDALFKFDSELMNPANQDGRFHWVIERLDFVQDTGGQKVLCLAQDPTPEGEEDDLVEDKGKKSGVAPPVGGKVDAATRVKLLKELDTQDDEKLHRELVKTENARKRFLTDLHSKRQLEQLKAAQRLMKADEERDTRLAKLEMIKQQQAEKAAAHKTLEEAKKSTVAQLEALMKQKEAAQIRRLIQEKDEQDRGMGREKDAARQRRKMQDRNANEVKKIEAERAQQLARKRADQVVKVDTVLDRKNRQIAEVVRDFKESEKAQKVELDETKEKIIEDLWAEKAEVRQELEKKNEEFEAMEEVRERKLLDREALRARMERDRHRAAREAERELKEETVDRLRRTHRDMLFQWKVDASNSACSLREQAKRNSVRDRATDDRGEIRLRKFRETQFLEQANRSRTGPMFATDESGPLVDEDGIAIYVPPEADIGECSAGEMEQFQRTYEQQERQRRNADREVLRLREAEKVGKLKDLKGKDPNAAELIRVRAWRKADDARQKKLDNARLKKEMGNEKIRKDQQVKRKQHEERWEDLEEKRMIMSVDMEKKRNEVLLKHIKNCKIGTGLPALLAY